MDLIREAFIVFMTEPQRVPLNEDVDMKTWVGWMVDEIDQIEYVSMVPESGYSKMHFFMQDELVLSIAIDEESNSFYCTLDEDKEQTRRETGEMAVILFNLMSKWEFEYLPNIGLDQPSYVQIFLSETNINLSTQEYETIENILKKMAKSKSLCYDNDLEEVAFELELRATIKNRSDVQLETEEESSEEWI